MVYYIAMFIKGLAISIAGIHTMDCIYKIVCKNKERKWIEQERQNQNDTDEKLALYNRYKRCFKGTPQSDEILLMYAMDNDISVRRFCICLYNAIQMEKGERLHTENMIINTYEQ